jgi:uncharacterized membrane protein
MLYLLGNQERSTLILPNGLKINSLLVLLGSLIVAFLASIGLQVLGIEIPVVRQITGFILVVLVPGVLILRILRIYNISNMHKIIYSVAISIAFLMFLGLISNTVLPWIGIPKPISFLPLVCLMLFSICLLALVCYFREKNIIPTKYDGGIHLSKVFSPEILLLVLLPVLAVLGALLIEKDQNSLVLLLLLLVIVIIIILFAFNAINKKNYILALFMISISLLLQTSLASSQLAGADIHVEYYLQNIVIQNGIWTPNIATNGNTALSITLLCPIFSLLLDIPSIWVFKIIYPLLFTVVPLTLFQVYYPQIGAKRAFFSVFFFMAVNVFFIEMLALARQQIAELFFSALVLLIMDTKIMRLSKLFLAVLFIIALPLSHYGTAYISIAFLAIGALMMWVLSDHRFTRLWQIIIRAKDKIYLGSVPKSILGSPLVLLFIVISISWYMYIANGSAFDNVVHIGRYIYNNLSDFLDPNMKSESVGVAMGLDLGTASLAGQTFRILQIVTQFFLLGGLITFLVKPKIFKFKAEFIALSVPAVLIIGASILVPGFSATLNASRIYHIGLLLLSPFCIVGGEQIFSTIARFVRRTIVRRRNTTGIERKDIRTRWLGWAVTFVIVPYFIFTSGLVYEVSGSDTSGDIPANKIGLSSYRVDGQVYNQMEAGATEYLAVFGDDTKLTYADTNGFFFMLERSLNQTRILSVTNPSINKKYYVFLRTYNIEKHEAIIPQMKGVQMHYSYVDIHEIISEDQFQIVYNNNSAQIWVTNDIN